MPTIKTPLTMEYALRGLLRQRPMHAYEIHQTPAQAVALGLIWHVLQGHLYARPRALQSRPIDAPRPTLPAIPPVIAPHSAQRQHPACRSG